ncbi:tyrosine-type recombinase/integrase [Phyllobacterium sp. P5_D12]
MAEAKTPIIELKNVDTYSPPAKGDPPLIYRDKIAKGLRLTVYPTGKKSFLYFYRNPQGEQRKWVMSFPSVSLTSARAKVAALKDVLERAKTDPALALSPEADPAAFEQGTKHAIRAPVPEDDLYPAVARQYLRDYVMGRGTAAKKAPKDSTIEQTARALGLKQDKTKAKWTWVEIRGGLSEQWQGKRFAALSKADVKHHLDDLLHNGSAKRQASGAPVTANRTYAVLKALWRWAQRENKLADGKRGEDITDWQRSGEEKRERFLTEAEIRAFWTATGEVGYPAGTALRVILLTGCRKSEVANMQRGELSEDLKRWTIPGGRTGRVKNREEHTLPILPDVRAILEGLPQKPFLFSYNGGTSPIKNFTAPHEKVVKRMEELLGVTYVDDPEAPWPRRPWVPHDLRHTFSTLNNERDPSASFVVEVVLNHKIKGMAGGYNHAEYKAQKYNLLEAWEAEIRRILEGKERPESHKKDPAVSW